MIATGAELAEVRIRWAIRHETMGLLRRLVDAGCAADFHFGAGCHFCRAAIGLDEDRPHEPDCPYVAARAYLERFPEPEECPHR